jgi:MYXO-CTERM domain-containing protein
VRVFTAAKTHDELHTVTALDETASLRDLGLQIVRIGLWTERDRLELDPRRLGLRGLLRRFVSELAVVHDLTDRRHGTGRHFHQVKPLLSGKVTTFIRSHNAQLLAFRPDHTDLRHTDLAIHTVRIALATGCATGVVAVSAAGITIHGIGRAATGSIHSVLVLEQVLPHTANVAAAQYDTCVKVSRTFASLSDSVSTRKPAPHFARTAVFTTFSALLPFISAPRGRIVLPHLSTCFGRGPEPGLCPMSAKMSNVRTSAVPRNLSTLCVFALFCAPACDLPEQSDETHGTWQAPVVYGDDDRQDWWEVEDPELQQLTRQSIVALMSLGSFDRSDPNNWIVTSNTLGENRNLCDGERYADQPAAAGCSGTLIGPDLVLTAGHCVDQNSCDGTVLVFDFFERADGVLETISANDAYPCVEVVSWALGDGLDFAVLRLDRPVDAARQPVPIRLEDTALAVGEPVYVVGFGSGIPAKIDTGGVVTDPRGGSLDYFQASLDTFGGNSGSGVFNADLELVGILVRGATDYVTDGDCTRVNVIPEEGLTGGEDITYGARAREAFCASGAVSDLLCPAGASMRCGACTTRTDCQGDLVCAAFPSLGGARVCAEPCGRDNPCADGFTCRGTACEPNTTNACNATSVVRVNECGRVLETVDACSATEFCRDASCVARLQGDVCASALPLDLASGALNEIPMDGFRGDYGGTCAGNGVDRVWRFTLDTRSQLVAEATGFDTVLYLRGDDCLSVDDEVVCNDDSDPPGAYGSRIDVVLDAGDWFLFLDAYNERTDVAALNWSVTPLCSDTCTEGDAYCEADLPRTCVRDMASGCTYFADAEPCGAREFCEDGACVALPPEPDVVDGPDATSDVSPDTTADASPDTTTDSGTPESDIRTDVDASDDAGVPETDGSTEEDVGPEPDTADGVTPVDDTRIDDDTGSPDPDAGNDTSEDDVAEADASQDDASEPDATTGDDTTAAIDIWLPPLPDIITDGSGDGAQPVDQEDVSGGSPGGCSATPTSTPAQHSALVLALGAVFAVRRVRRRP